MAFSISTTPHCLHATEQNLGSPRNFSVDTNVGWRLEAPTGVPAIAAIGAPLQLQPVGADEWKNTANQIKLPRKIGLGKRSYRRWINRRLLIGNLRRLVHEKGQLLGSDDLGDYIDDELLGIPCGRSTSRHRGLYVPGAQYIPGYRSAPNLWWQKLMLDEEVWWSFRKRREVLPPSPVRGFVPTGWPSGLLAGPAKQSSADVQQKQSFERRVLQIFNCMRRSIVLGPPFIMNFLRTVEETTFSSLVDSSFCKLKKSTHGSLPPKYCNPNVLGRARFYHLDCPSLLVEVFPRQEVVKRLQDTLVTRTPTGPISSVDPNESADACIILVGLPSLHRKLCYLICRSWKLLYQSYQVDASDLLALLGNSTQVTRGLKRSRRNRIQKIVVLQLASNTRLSLPEHSIHRCLQELLDCKDEGSVHGASTVHVGWEPSSGPRCDELQIPKCSTTTKEEHKSSADRCIGANALHPITSSRCCGESVGEEEDCSTSLQ